MIRKITSKDIDTVNKLINKKHLTNDNITFNPYNRYYVYELNNKIIAYIEYAIMYNRAELNYIYVLEKYRKQKIASMLLAFMLKEVEEKKCVNVSLEVNINNHIARSFYNKNGFVEKTIRNKYYDGEDGVLMVREMI